MVFFFSAGRLLSGFDGCQFLKFFVDVKPWEQHPALLHMGSTNGVKGEGFFPRSFKDRHSQLLADLLGS